MYRHFAKPLLFSLPPEKAHRLTFAGLKILQQLKLQVLLQLNKTKALDDKCSCEVFGLSFPNPVGVAAGLDKNAELVSVFPYLGFGFVEIGTVTPRGQHGNPQPRLFRLPRDLALINRMGFNNEGADKIAARLAYRPKNFIVGGNIGKNTHTPNEKAVDDYLYVLDKLYPVADYFVVNVSCPNISNLSELQNKDNLYRILSAVQKKRKQYRTYKPVLLKLSPDLNNRQIDESIAIAVETGMDGFVIANTTISRDNLNETPARLKETGSGGLSGRPLTWRSTEMIRHVYKQTGDKMPIIGVGGIFSAADAMEKLKAGASLIQLYTGFIYEGPRLVSFIKKGISQSIP